MKYGLSPIRTPTKSKSAGKKTFLSPDFSIMQAFLYEDKDEEDSDDEYDAQMLYDLVKQRSSRRSEIQEGTLFSSTVGAADVNVTTCPDPSAFNLEVNEAKDADFENPENVNEKVKSVTDNTKIVFDRLKLAYTKLYNQMQEIDDVMELVKPCSIEAGYSPEHGGSNRRVILNHRSVYLSKNVHAKRKHKIHRRKSKESNFQDTKQLTLVARKSGLRNLRKILPITQLQVGMFTVKKVPLDVEIVDSHPKYGPHFIFTVAYDTNMEETDVVKAFKPATATLVVIVAVYVYLVFFINWAYLFLFPPLVAAGILFFYNVSPFAPMEGIAQFRVNIKDITGWNHRSLLTDHAEVSLETKVITRLWRTNSTIPIPETPRSSIYGHASMQSQKRKKARSKTSEIIEKLGNVEEETENENLEKKETGASCDNNEVVEDSSGECHIGARNTSNKSKDEVKQPASVSLEKIDNLNSNILEDLLEMQSKSDGLRKRKTSRADLDGDGHDRSTKRSSGTSRSRKSSAIDLAKATDVVKECYENQILKFRYTEPLIHPLLKHFVRDNEQLIPLVEDGLPSWALFLAGYGLYYRKWMRRTMDSILWIASVGMMVLAFYDLFQNVPMVRHYAKQLFGRWFGWLDSLMSAFRLIFLPLFVSLTPVIRGMQGIFNGIVLMFKPLFSFLFAIFKACYSLVKSLCSCCKSAKDAARIGAGISKAGSKVPSASLLKLIYRTCKWMWNIFRSIFIVGFGRMGSYLSSHTESIYRLYFVKHKDLIVKVLIFIFTLAVVLSILL